MNSNWEQDGLVEQITVDGKTNTTSKPQHIHLTAMELTGSPVYLQEVQDGPCPPCRLSDQMLLSLPLSQCLAPPGSDKSLMVKSNGLHVIAMF